MKQITCGDVSALSAAASEIQDGRFAQINGHLFEIVSYDDAAVLTIYDSPDMCGPDHSFHHDEEDVLEIWMGEEKEVEALFSQRIVERLAI